jgi:DNA adenine methylase
MSAVAVASDDHPDWQLQVARASPLFKWAGGKQRFLWTNAHRIPHISGTYIEPFAGGLSMLFHVARNSGPSFRAMASDTNLRLVRCYVAVRKDWAAVSDELRQLEAGYAAASDKTAFYMARRAEHNAVSPRADAARFIFLMCAGWNGVYRTNRRGHFNVPPGQLKGPLRLPSPDHLESVSTVFKRTTIRATSWESSLVAARPGDFVFLDPPYFSSSRSQLYDGTASFGFREQERLADSLVDLRNRGVDFLLTNAADPAMVELYRARGLLVETIDMHRSISSRSSTRGAEGELIVRPGAVHSRHRAAAALSLKVRFGMRDKGTSTHG